YNPQTESGALPANGESWGTKADEWTLFQGMTGFVLVAANANGVADVNKSAQVSSSGPEALVTLTTGVLLTDAFDARLMPRDPDAQVWLDGDTGWVLDLAGATSLTAGTQYGAWVVRDEFNEPVREPHGLFYVSLIANNLGSSLFNTSAWL